MNLVRIGKEIINLDLIKRVEIVDDKSVILYFSFTSDKDFIIYKGKEARLLRKFLEKNSTDITEEEGEAGTVESEIDQQEEIGKKKKGSKKRSQTEPSNT